MKKSNDADPGQVDQTSAEPATRDEYLDLLALDGVLFVSGRLDSVNADALPEAERRGFIRFRLGKWQVTGAGRSFGHENWRLLKRSGRYQRRGAPGPFAVVRDDDGEVMSSHEWLSDAAMRARSLALSFSGKFRVLNAEGEEVYNA